MFQITIAEKYVWIALLSRMRLPKGYDNRAAKCFIRLDKRLQGIDCVRSRYHAKSLNELQRAVNMVFVVELSKPCNRACLGRQVLGSHCGLGLRLLIK